MLPDVEIPQEILFSTTKYENTLICNVCPKACLIKEDEIGYCGIRFNNGHGIISKTYGKTTGIAIDPVEKKPLYHFQPGTDTLSIGGIGCNLSCEFCQNFSTSQLRDYENANFLEKFSPEEIVKIALRKKIPSISVTYNEPMINLEYVVEISNLAHENDLKIIAVSNGFLQKRTSEFLSRYIDAANVDFKGDKNFYRNICDARQTPVKQTIETWVDSGMHVEVTTLIIPGYNDSNEFISETTSWINERLGKDLPLHFSRFYPRYKLQKVPITHLETLLNCKEIALKNGLSYVYVGNVGFEVDNNTYCQYCKNLLVERGLASGSKRKGYATQVSSYDKENNQCVKCRNQSPFKN